MYCPPPPKPVYASTPTLKHKIITTTSSTSQTQSQIVNIPNLLNIVSITSDTGTVNYSTVGENVTINASGGIVKSTQWNSTKFTTLKTLTLNSWSNNLSSTYNYDDGTYSGTLKGMGVTSAVVQTGGTYTPADTQNFTVQGYSAPGGAVPSTYYYNNNGYVGTLYPTGGSSLVSGSPAGSKYVDVDIYPGNTLVQYSIYNDGVYSGSVSYVGSYYSWGGSPPGYDSRYIGTVYKPDDRVYVQSYTGSATKPASDTRTWATQYSQNYSGAVYAGGYDNLYSYTLTIGYYDDVMSLNVDSSVIGVDTTNAINIDNLKNWDVTKPVGFDPTQLTEKTIELNNDYITVTNNQVEKMQNKAASPVDANMYAVAYNGYDYEEWTPMNPDGTFSQNMYFNEPGIYHSKIKFKNYTTESEPLDKYYLADWISPTVNVQSKIPGQTAVTGNTYEVTLTANDNLSPYLFYTTDNTNWYLIQKGVNDITFNNIAKSPQGTLNKLTLKVSDLCGNVEEKTMTVWGIQ